MKSEQISVTFPQKKKQYKEELIRMRDQENINISSYVVALLEKELDGSQKMNHDPLEISFAESVKRIGGATIPEYPENAIRGTYGAVTAV